MASSVKFSANLGFLWADLPLAEGISAAHRAGFDAVECHWPFAERVQEVRAALEETRLPMLSLNTRRGNVAAGDFGLAALPERRAEARAAIEEALGYAVEIGARAVHVMAGRSEGPAARATFLANLDFACGLSAPHGITILIEPLNRFDAPGYFLSTLDQARSVLADLNRPEARLMFDCYHAGRTGGQVLLQLAEMLPLIGHIQIASVPDRGPPDHGVLDYGKVFAELSRLGWSAPLGAEYHPRGPTEATLGWLTAEKARSRSDQRGLWGKKRG